MKALVVGQAPSRDTDGRAPFTGRSGARLAEMLGVEPRALPRVVDLVNLLDRWPGKDGKGDAWHAAEAKAAARMLLAVSPHQVLVLCGGNVVRAFGYKLGPLERGMLGGRFVLHLPHPSGINRWWNEPGNADRARSALRLVAGSDLCLLATG